MKRTKYILFMVSFVVLLILNTIKTQAFSPERLEEQIDIDSIIEALPDSSKEYLPENLKNSDELIKEIQKTETDSITTVVFKSIKKTLPSLTKKLFSLIGVLMTISIINTLKNNLTNSAYSKALTLLTSAVLSIFIYELFNDIWIDTEAYLSSINTVITALIPIMTLLYTMGGNVSTAIVNSSGLAFLLTVTNGILQSCLLPLSKICFGPSMEI